MLVVTTTYTAQNVVVRKCGRCLSHLAVGGPWTTVTSWEALGFCECFAAIKELVVWSSLGAADAGIR